MELQNQIFLLIAIFGGVCTLLLVFIVVLAIYVVNLKKTVTTVKEPERKYENYGFEHEMPVHNITDDLRSMKSQNNRRPPQKSNLSKPRNDDVRTNTRRTEKQPTGGMGRDERKRQYSESGDTSGRDFDSAFDNEINNMFDLDDDDDDRESVVSDRNSRYNQQRRQKNTAPLPPSAGGIDPNRGNRNRNFSHNENHQQHQISRPMRGSGYPGSGYNSGNPHEGKTYFNERGMY